MFHVEHLIARRRPTGRRLFFYKRREEGESRALVLRLFLRWGFCFLSARKSSKEPQVWSCVFFEGLSSRLACLLLRKEWDTAGGYRLSTWVPSAKDENAPCGASTKSCAAVLFWHQKSTQKSAAVRTQRTRAPRRAPRQERRYIPSMFVTPS